MSVEKIVEVVCVSTKNEKHYDQILKDKNVQTVAVIQGLQGAKGDKGADAFVQEISDIEIERLFE